MVIVSLGYIILVLFSIIYGKVTKNSFNLSGLYKSNTQSLKGLLSISILLSHLSGNTVHHMPFFSFSAMGSIGVGCFYFLSGYGLVKASDKNGYFDGYLIKHFVKILIPFFIMFIFWVVTFQLILGESFSLLLNSFLSGNPVSNSWYVFSALYCYIVYCLAYRNRKSYSFYVVLLFLLLWIVFCALVLKWPDWWYKTICNFAIGMIWGKNEKGLNRKINDHYYLLSFLALGLLMFSYLFPHFFGNIITGNMLWLINDTLMGIAGVFFLGIFIQKLNLINPISKYLGYISYEIYLIHGLVIGIFNSFTLGIKELDILHQELACLGVIIITIVYSVVLHNLSNRLIKIFSS